MKLLLLVIVFFCFRLTSKGQDTSIKQNKYDSSINMERVRNGKYSHFTYLSSDNQLLTKREIRERLTSYEPSAIEYKKYKRSFPLVTFWGVCAVASFAHSKNAFDQNHTDTYNTFLVIGLGCLTLEIINAIGIPRHFKKAIKLYNHHIGGMDSN